MVGLSAGVVALTEHAGMLYAGGTFTFGQDDSTGNVARWDGTSWEGVGNGTNDVVWALASFKGKLIAGGRFTRAGDTDVRNIAGWDGLTWAPLDNGLSAFDGHPIVSDLQTIGDSLVVTGDFHYAGDIPARSIAVWDGMRWDSFGDATGWLQESVIFYSVTSYGGRLVAHGIVGLQDFGHSGNIAVWEGNRWAPLIRGGVRLAGYSDDLLPTPEGVIAADFFALPGGFESVYAVARWNGTSWDLLATEIHGRVRCLALYRGRVIAAGRFTRFAGVAANNIAQWDGVSWTALGEGTDNQINDVMVYHDRLVATGVFERAGAVPAAHIAEWDGNTWSALGSGLTGPVPCPPCDLVLGAELEVLRGSLFVAGHFTHAGNIQAAALALWDGESWRSIGGDIAYLDDDPWVFDLEPWMEGLVASGPFSSISGTESQGLGIWDGEVWKPLLFRPGVVTRLGTYENKLVIGGGFFSLDTPEQNAIFQWDGNRWYRMGTGLWDGKLNTLSHPTAFTSWRGSLYASGTFEAAGSFPSYHFARWDGWAVQAQSVPQFLEVTPNPVQGETNIRWYNNDAGFVRLVLFDALGRRVRTLASNSQLRGTQTLTWVPRDDAGNAMPSGVYFLRLETERGTTHRKIVVLR